MNIGQGFDFVLINDPRWQVLSIQFSFLLKEDSFTSAPRVRNGQENLWVFPNPVRLRGVYNLVVAFISVVISYSILLSEQGSSRAESSYFVSISVETKT